MDIAETAAKELELSFMMKRFLDATMEKGFNQCQVCAELQKTAAMLHFVFCKEHYPEITDQGKVKTFEDCAGEQCRIFLRSTRGF